MLINLQKSFQFARDGKEYSVDYMFTSNRLYSNADNKLLLELGISVNGGEKITRSISKSSSTLYLSNEVIEKVIEEDVLSALAENKEVIAE